LAPVVVRLPAFTLLPTDREPKSPLLVELPELLLIGKLLL